MAAADDQIVADKLPSVSSTSSLPSLASSQPSSASISELDNTIATQTTQGERMNPNTNNSTNITNMQQQQYKKRPFQSLTKLSTNGPFQKLQFHIITILYVICCLLSSTVSAATVTTHTNQYQYHLRRHLEDNNSGDNNNDGWTGEWNGEWTATDDMSFECDDDGGCKQTKPSGSDSNSSSNSMWYDNGDLLTPEQIITYVSLGALTFMTLLCCLCYPEIITGKYALVLFYHVHVCVFNHGLGGVGRFVLT